jgi:starch synthase
MVLFQWYVGWAAWWGNGFKFSEYSSEKLQETMSVALAAYQQKETWQELVRRGMAEDHSWTTSAEAYQKLYMHLSSPATIPA